MEPRCSICGGHMELLPDGEYWIEVCRCEASHPRIAELEQQLEEAKAEAEKEERRHLETIDRRDAAEEACSQMYYLITGNSPHWSNVFGYAQAIEDVDDAQTALHTWGKDGDAKIKELDRQLIEVDYALIAYRHFRPVDDAPACQKAYEAALERSQKRRQATLAREEARKKGAEHGE